jgi:orotate phosphoribosyltransferase
MVASHPEVEASVAEALANKLVDAPEQVFPIDLTVGPGSGAITLASRLAQSIGVIQDFVCLTTFLDKATGKLRTPMRRGEFVLACEDTISSGGSVQRTIDAIESVGGIALPAIVAVCNRSSLTHVGHRRIVPLICTPMQNWTAEECPLCKTGSKAIKPKDGDNWNLLQQDY